MTAAYMRILIHTMNNSLFPDADPSSTTWNGPPPGIVAVQSLLYASLTTSLFAAFLAMLGKQWVNRYLRNRAGSAADKSRDRQRKLDGLEKWYFHLTIESLPVMLQLALLLLGCALSRYLWTTSRAVATVIVAVTLFGVTSYIFLTLAAIFSYNCPYQTPPSILARALIRYLAHNNNTFARSLRSLVASFPSIEVLRRILRHIRAEVCKALKRSGPILGVPEGAEHIPRAAITSSSPVRIFDEVSTDWEVCKADIRCISWVLYTTTDTDVIYSTVRFSADVIWYPEIARNLSPHILAELFFDCLSDGKVVPGKSEHASSIGMALASVLSTQLSMEPGNQELKALCERIDDDVRWIPSSGSTLALVVAALGFIADITTRGYHSAFMRRKLMENTRADLPPTQKLWLGRVILQTLWRWRRVMGPTGVLKFHAMESICESFNADADNDLIPAILKTNCFLMMAISLGLQIDIRDLYAPNNRCTPSNSSHGFHSLDDSEVLQTSLYLFSQQLTRSIKEGTATSSTLNLVISTLTHVDPFQTKHDREYEFLWLTDILDSGYSDNERWGMATTVVRLLGRGFHSPGPGSFPPGWIPPLLGFLSLCEKFGPAEGSTALRILSSSPPHPGFNATILPILTSVLQPAHPLLSRNLALNLFHNFAPEWFSQQMEGVPHKDLIALLQAVGDPFQPLRPPLQDRLPVNTTDYEPMMAAIVLIGFASSDLWRDHLRRSNFASYEEILSTEEGKRVALGPIFHTATHLWLEFLCTSAKVITAIKRLEELQCLNTAEAVLFWAWTVGVMDVGDQGAWGLIERSTLDFYRTHGIRRLTALSWHITNKITEDKHVRFLLACYGDRSCQVGNVRPPVPIGQAVRKLRPRNFEELRIAKACQLRRLYHLFGYDPVTWKEAVAMDEVNQEMDVLPVQLVRPIQFTDWGCDYP